MIHIVLDMDGVILAQNDNPHYLIYSTNDNLLPPEWRNYKKNNTIIVNYNGGYYTLLLLPGILEMLQFFLIELKDIVRVSFFSAGAEERNIQVAEILKNKVAANAGVHPGTIEYNVFSSIHCVRLFSDSELQPDSNNNPHIPLGCNFWRGEGTNLKKILRRVFGNDISNVILFDNSYCVMTRGETDHHDKVPTFAGFSGSDFIDYQATEMTTEQQIDLNYSFLDDNQFYAVNAAALIAGTVSEIVLATIKLNISASAALKLLQICPETNKYKQALYQNPIYERYEPSFYYQGFYMLSKIRPVPLYAPYPKLAMEALQSIYEGLNYHIKYSLMNATLDYWPPNIYYIISKYCDNGFFDDSQPSQEVLSQAADIDHSDPKQENPVEANLSMETLQAISEEKNPEEKNERDCIISPDTLPSQLGFFSLKDKANNGNTTSKTSTTIDISLLRRDYSISDEIQPEKINTRCCAIL